MNRTLPVILILAAVALFALYVSPTYKNTIVPLRESIRQSSAALAAAQDFQAKQAEIATQRASIHEGDIEKIQKFLPDGVDNVQMVLDLNALASRSGILLSNFKIVENTVPVGRVTIEGASAAPSKSIDSLDLTVTATGTYSAFRTFLYGIEHSLRPLDITQIAVSNSENGVYTYDMTLRIYWLH